MDALNLYWGDLHNHNEVGYGEGSIRRTYEIARNSLDFLAFTPHGWWPDPPGQDAALVAKHEAGFGRVRQAWPGVIEQARAANEPGCFAALLGFEWHSCQWGDYQVIFPDHVGEICRADSLAVLQRFVREHRAIMIPHHCAYRLGWRGTNWREHDEVLSPVAEIFSEHGCSFESPSPYPMNRHSMGGATCSQTVLEQLKAGKRIGLTAGTDNHHGYPGSYGEGLTGVWAAQLTPASIHEALRRRHVYACTGDRIEVMCRLGRGIMGDLLPAASPRELHVRVKAADALEYVELIRSGQTLHRWLGGESRGGDDPRRTWRIEWGWGPMASRHVTDWRITLRLHGGAIEQALPCFSGGPATLGRVNTLSLDDPHQCRVQSFTSRANPRATHALVMHGTHVAHDAVLELHVQGLDQQSPFDLKQSVKLNDLNHDEHWLAVHESFSAPRLCIHPVHHTSDLTFDAEFTDSHPTDHDFYMLKVVQKNGHMAWTTPIWCCDD